MIEKSNEKLKKWLAFRSSNQEYGIDIMRVQEMRGYEPDKVTRVAHALPHMLGMINLRGQIIPVIDLRVKLGMGEATFNEQTVIIILDLKPKMLGMVVDSVSGDMDLAESDIQPPPKSRDVGIADFLIGLANHDDQLIQILDVDRMLDADSDAAPATTQIATAE